MTSLTGWTKISKKSSYASKRAAAQQPWRESASDYERGVIDGRQMQAQSSVDKAVNAMTQRPWVGLTDEDWKEIEDMPDTFDQGVAWCLAKLKGKNNG